MRERLTVEREIQDLALEGEVPSSSQVKSAATSRIIGTTNSNMVRIF